MLKAYAYGFNENLLYNYFFWFKIKKIIFDPEYARFAYIMDKSIFDHLSRILNRRGKLRSMIKEMRITSKYLQNNVEQLIRTGHHNLEKFSNINNI